ncbi:hypothetical protein DL767_010531 [Monosporascus sp. MG133]|nr:hypothetical protein DL767_010531 [Monosporascus sp. MG133]
MAEPVGTAIGVLGLAGLFSTTLQAWSFIDAGRAHAKNFSLFRTKLDNQRILFMIWGKKMGFGSVEGYDKRLDDPFIAQPIEQTLNHIQQLFSDADALVREYGIEVLEKKTIKAVSVARSSAIFKPNYDSFLRMVNDQQKHEESRFNRFLKSLRRHQKKASIWKVTKWSIRDEKKFDAIVQHLAGLVSDLDSMTEKFFSPARSEDLAIQEVWKINDVNALSEIEDATGGTKTILSRAASIRRQSIESSRPVSRSSDIAGKITRRSSSPSVEGTARAQRQDDNLVRPASNMTDASFKTAYSQPDWSANSRPPERAPVPRWSVPSRPPEYAPAPCWSVPSRPAELAVGDEPGMMRLHPITEEDDEQLSELYAANLPSRDYSMMLQAAQPLGEGQYIESRYLMSGRAS